MNNYPPIPPDDLRRHITLARPNRPEYTAHRHRRRYLHDPCHGRRHQWPLLSDRYAHPAWRRPSSASTRLRRDVHDARRRTRSHLPRQEVDRACWRYGQHVQRTAPVPQRVGAASAVAVPLLAVGAGETLPRSWSARCNSTMAPPKLSAAAQAEFKAKSLALSPKYRTELLEHA